ncbi:MAG: hypothetical protein ACRBN8_30030 [Nannocystales bacterium]
MLAFLAALLLYVAPVGYSEQPPEGPEACTSTAWALLPFLKKDREVLLGACKKPIGAGEAAPLAVQDLVRRGGRFAAAARSFLAASKLPSKVKRTTFDNCEVCVNTAKAERGFEKIGLMAGSVATVDDKFSLTLLFRPERSPGEAVEVVYITKSGEVERIPIAPPKGDDGAAETFEAATVWLPLGAQYTVVAESVAGTQFHTEGVAVPAPHYLLLPRLATADACVFLRTRQADGYDARLFVDGRRAEAGVAWGKAGETAEAVLVLMSAPGEPRHIVRRTVQFPKVSESRGSCSQILMPTPSRSNILLLTEVESACEEAGLSRSVVDAAARGRIDDVENATLVPLADWADLVSDYGKLLGRLDQLGDGSWRNQSSGALENATSQLQARGVDKVYVVKASCDGARATLISSEIDVDALVFQPTTRGEGRQEVRMLQARTEGRIGIDAGLAVGAGVAQLLGKDSVIVGQTGLRSSHRDSPRLGGREYRGLKRDLEDPVVAYASYLSVPGDTAPTCSLLKDARARGSLSEIRDAIRHRGGGRSAGVRISLESATVIPGPEQFHAPVPWTEILVVRIPNNTGQDGPMDVVDAVCVHRELPLLQFAVEGSFGGSMYGRRHRRRPHLSEYQRILIQGTWTPMRKRVSEWGYGLSAGYMRTQVLLLSEPTWPNAGDFSDGIASSEYVRRALQVGPHIRFRRRLVRRSLPRTRRWTRRGKERHEKREADAKRERRIQRGQRMVELGFQSGLLGDFAWVSRVEGGGLSPARRSVDADLYLNGMVYVRVQRSLELSFGGGVTGTGLAQAARSFNPEQRSRRGDSNYNFGALYGVTVAAAWLPSIGSEM